jgi:hypothetical protein
MAFGQKPKAKVETNMASVLRWFFKSIYKLVSRIFLQSMTSRIDKKKISVFKKNKISRQIGIRSTWERAKKLALNSSTSFKYIRGHEDDAVWCYTCSE